MKLTFTKDLVPGMCVGGDVNDREGLLKLLPQGAVLNEAQINSLINWGLPSVYIDDAIEEVKEKAVAIHMTKLEFINSYKDTLDKIIHVFTHIKKYKEVPIDEIQELIDQKVILLVETIGALEYLHEIRCYNESTFHHSLNVAVIAGVLGKWCNYKGTELEDLILTGLLHDIGKLSVPLTILDKPGRLTNEEFNAIKFHSQKGYEIVKDNAQIPESVKLGIWQHHERLDGSGYPLKLVGDEINAGAKIISIIDSYDAITSDRIYRHKRTPFEALDILAKEMYKKLEPDTCLTFLDNMRNYLAGSNVVLSNGLKAKIIAFSDRTRDFAKPIVRLEDGNFVDLKKTDTSIVDW